MGQLKDLKWLNRFLSETPGDKEVGGRSRQVPNACWSRVLPTPSPNPNYACGQMRLPISWDLSVEKEMFWVVVSQWKAWTHTHRGMVDTNSATGLVNSAMVERLRLVKLKPKMVCLNYNSKVREKLLTLDIQMAKPCLDHLSENSCVVKQCSILEFRQQEHCLCHNW